MASIFLSYARDDLAKAERLAAFLDEAGHSTWWDRHLHAGARFSAEIDEALRSADVIVVLWSGQSVESAWVQDEAAVGRDSGRLIPVLLENVAPPLGFRQYQAVDFSNWPGRGKPRNWAQLAGSLGPKSPTKPGATLRAPLAGDGRRVPRWVLMTGAAALVLAAAAGVWLRFGPDSHGLELAISASPSSDSASRAFAHQVALDLTRYQSAYLESLSVLEDDQSARSPQYRAQLGLNREGEKLRADVSLMVKRRPGVSWVDSLEGQSSRVADLRQQAASTLANALGCAIKAESSSARLGDADYRLFLKGCTALSATYASFSSADLVPIFKKVTQSAPQFAPAQSMLAFAELMSIAVAPAYQRPAIIREAKAAVARAKQLDPDAEETIAVDSFSSRDPGQWSHAFPILDRGLALHPSSALLLGLRSDLLMTAGRMNEASDNARQALQFDPLSPQTRVNFINALIYAGKMAEAQDELAKAEAIWPNSVVLEEARYRLELRYGDPRAVLAQLRKSGGGDANPISTARSYEYFLLARIDPTPTNVETALQSLRERYRRNPADIPDYVQALGTFGRVDEAFRATANSVTLDSLDANTDILFRPHMRSLWYDPRFMKLSHDLGLLAFWKQSGMWPDLCDDLKLPYDCRQEAAKYRD